MSRKKNKKSILLDAIKRTRSRELMPLSKVVQDKKKKAQREVCRSNRNVDQD